MVSTPELIIYLVLFAVAMLFGVAFGHEGEVLGGKNFPRERDLFLAGFALGVAACLFVNRD